MRTLQGESKDSLDIYRDEKTVSFYASAEGLQRGEQTVFAKYIRDGDHILDVGVGGGRTTPYLSRKAGRYLGVDYSEPMVEACKRKFPNLEFSTMDATNLVSIPDSSFDIVVFSFNGIDCLPTNGLRTDCLSNIRRVLKPRGLFIFSSHNARVLFIKPDYAGANLMRRVWRTFRLARNLILIIRQVGRKAFYRGEGYIVDPVHGGHFMHVTTPYWAHKELREHSFDVLDTVDALSPRPAGQFTSAGYYYVARKLDDGQL